MYSLVSASVLAIDLARHPHGAAVADVVDRVLALSPADVSALPAPAPGDVRARVLHSISDAPRMSRLMTGVAAIVAGGLPTARESRTVVEALSETLLGGLEDLHALLRREEPLYGAQHAQTALDAVTVAWAGRQADLADLAVLHAPWREAVDPVPPALPLAAYSLELRGLLDAISTRHPSAWRRTADAHDARRGSFTWSTAMHESCQAAYDHGRLLEVARAQLAAARVLRLSGASTGPDAHGVAMAVTAAVQATCTRDLIDPEVHVALSQAWEAGS